MQAYKTCYTVIQDGELVLRDIPFSKGKKLEVIVIEELKEGGTLKNWREIYFEKILSTSVWSEEVTRRVEQAGKELNQWNIPAS